MKIIHYIKIQNFKVFGEEKTIELDHPSVLIGPNNSGKTTALQALALWNLGAKRWFDAKANSKGIKNISTGINRLEIISVPVLEAKYFWKNTVIRKGNANYIPLKITVGLFYNNKSEECSFVFTYFTPEVIYCEPDEKTYINKKLLEFASTLNIEILYPMSGISTEETLIPEGRINVLIGEGKTAEIIRNLCFQIAENDKAKKTKDWLEVTKLIKLLFSVDLQIPVFNKTRGSIELKYKVENIKNPLDISLSGRGQQQMLLLIAYIYVHKNSVILLDEPDAHLEILRQKQVFTVLKETASRNKCQIIIATHSEVILEDASDTNLVMLIDGEPFNLASKSEIKNALKNFGIEHYYKARLCKSVIYVEGSTDINILRKFADKLQNNEALNLLTSNFNYYYTQNINPEYKFENQLEQSAGYFRNYKNHFFAIKPVVPEFKGIAIFDNDNKDRQNDYTGDLVSVYWKKYEIENYFINPDVIISYFKEKFNISFGPLFSDESSKILDLLIKILEDNIKKIIFNDDTLSFNEYNKLTPALKHTIWLNATKNIKLSSFLENVLTDFSNIRKEPVLLNKGQYYELIDFLDAKKIDTEINEVLNLIVKTLKTE